jgi:N-methylhydantoinase A
VAELLDAPSVVFPAHASVLSAFGALVTPVRIDLARSFVRRLDLVTDDEREAMLEEMRAEGRSVLSPPASPSTPSRSATPSTRATTARATRSRSRSAKARRGR